MSEKVGHLPIRTLTKFTRALMKIRSDTMTKCVKLYKMTMFKKIEYGLYIYINGKWFKRIYSTKL